MALKIKGKRDLPPVVVPLDGPCVCGSEKVLQTCCYREGEIHVAESDTRPRGERTGYAHAACYARALNDCSEDLTLEHFLTKGVTEALMRAKGGTALDVSWPKIFGQKIVTLPPQRTGAARILCGRHNNALSPIDTTALRMFAGIAEASKKHPTFRSRFVSGRDVERWLLKVCLGSMSAVGANVPELWVRILFSQCGFPANWGLYMFPRIGAPIAGAEQATGAWLDDAGHPVGFKVTLNGVNLILSMRDIPLAPTEGIGAVRLYRPSGIDWIAPGGREQNFLLGFSWLHRTDRSGLRLEISCT